MTKLYISYARAQKAIADTIIDFANQHGYKSFIDSELTIGENYAKTITDNIKQSTIIIFIISNESLKSQWCRREIEYAVKLHKTIIPVIVGTTFHSLETSWYRSIFKLSDCIHWPNDDLFQLLVHLKDYIGTHSNILPDDAIQRVVDNYFSTFIVQKTKPKNGRSFYIIFLSIIGILTISFLVYFISISRSMAPTSSGAVIVDTEYNREIDNMRSSAPNINVDKPKSDVIVDSINSITNIKAEDIYENITENSQSTISKIEEIEYINHIDYSKFWIFGFVIIFVFIGYLFAKNHRKIDIKIVADSDCKVFADNNEITTLSANKVEHITLKRGNYYLLFEPCDKNLICESRSYAPKKSGDLINITFPKAENQQTQNSHESVTLKCFIAGSVKLETERDTLRAAISQIHNQWSKRNITILSYTFEDFKQQIVEGGQQQLYDDFIANDATITVFIISGEIGAKTKEEFELALNAYKTKRHPQILIFNDNNAGFHEHSENLKHIVSSEKQYWVNYNSLKELKLQFMSTLHWLLVEIV